MGENSVSVGDGKKPSVQRACPVVSKLLMAREHM